MRLPAAIFMMSCIATLSASTPSPKLWGCVIEDNSWEAYDGKYGVYTISTADGSAEMLGFDYTMIANAGGFFADGNFYSVNNSKMWGSVFTNMSVYDTDTWEADWSARKGSNNMKMVAMAMVYDPASKKAYGCYHTEDEDGYELGEADYSTFTRTTLCAVENPLVAMAMSDDGTVYGIDADGNLSTMDKNTGVLTPIGSTGLLLETKIQGCVYDPASKAIILAAEPREGNSALYSINIANGGATKLTVLPHDQYITVLAMPQDPPAGAPASATGLALSFEGGSTSGTVSFGIPNVTFGGQELSGDVNYSIIVNKQEYKSGNATPGTTVTEPLDVEEGDLTVMVALSNNAGKSRKVKADMRVGFAMPGGPYPVKAELDPETHTVTITWKAVTETLEQGFFDVDNIRYNVVRIPDDKVVAGGISGTMCSDDLPWGEWKGYSYKVTAVNGTKESYPSTTNFVALGDPLAPPYSEDFSTVEGFGGYTIISENQAADHSSWNHDSFSGYVTIHGDAYGLNDWIVTPPFELKTGKVYVFSFSCKETFTSGDAKERIAVTFGTSENPAKNAILMSPTDVNWDDFRQMEFDVEVAEDGVYRFGVHALSEPNMPGLSIDEVALGDGFDPTAPAKVSDLTVNCAPRGALSATVSFDLPVKTVGGAELTSVSRVDVYRDGQICASATEGLFPGARLALPDRLEGMTAGRHDYSVVAFVGETRGRTARTNVFIGPDAPSTIRNLRFEDNFDGTVTLRWDAPDENGLNGGWADNEGMTYNVAITNNEGVFVGEETLTDTKYIVKDIDLTGKQRLIGAKVTPANTIGTGKEESTYSPLYGAPYELPFVEHLTDGFLTYDTWYSSIMNGAQFGIFMIIGGDLGVEDACFSYAAKQSGDHSTLSSGKISLEGAVNPELSFNYATAPGEHMTLEVLIDKATHGLDSVALLDFATMEDTGNDWEHYTVDLTPFKELPYIMLNFKGTLNSTGTAMLIGGISVREKEKDAISVIYDDTANDVKVLPGREEVTIMSKDEVIVEIYSVSGSSIWTGRVDGCRNISLESGCYIVRAGAKAVKILI